jgi:S1-C subfamily serine protease
MPPSPPFRAPLPRRHLLGLLGSAWLLPAANASALPDLVARAKLAVVAMGTFDALANPRFTFRGTGFVVGDGLTVVTNAHVLPTPGSPGAAAEPRLALHLPGRRTGTLDAGDTRPLTLLALDREHDLAVLRFDGTPLPTLALAPEGSAREGQSVALIGFPLGGLLGFSHVTHRGIVSSITPIVLPPAHASQLEAAAVARMRQGVFDILQLDATAYPGNSGGPLLDVESGEVVGIVNMVVVKTTRESALSTPSGISYAIPVKWLHALLARR